MIDIDPGWWWVSAGLLLAAAEIVAPGVFLVWIGVAAGLTGILTLISGVALPVQLGLFAAIAVGAVLAARRWTNVIGRASPSLLNEPGERLIGQTVVAIGVVDADGGRVRLGDGAWPARCWRPLADGERARVLGLEDGWLLVDRVEALDKAD